MKNRVPELEKVPFLFIYLFIYLFFGSFKLSKLMCMMVSRDYSAFVSTYQLTLSSYQSHRLGRVRDSQITHPARVKVQDKAHSSHCADATIPGRKYCFPSCH